MAISVLTSGYILAGVLVGAALGLGGNIVHDDFVSKSVVHTYIDGPEGIREAHLESGVSREDLEFLKSYRRPLTGDDIPVSELRQRLREVMTVDFQKTRAPIDRRYPQLSEREKFILFLVLRVNGSMPVYKTRKLPMLTFPDMIKALDGNCYDTSIRLSLLLEAFGIHNAIVTIFTSALPGHVIVTAYDQQERTAYFLDGNTNVFLPLRNVDEDLLTLLAKATPEGRKKLMAQAMGAGTALPVYFPFYAPPPEVAFSAAPLTADYLNQMIPGTRATAWTATFTDQFDQLVNSWKGTHLEPRTLAQTADFFAPQTAKDAPGLRDFSPRMGLDLSALDAKLNLHRTANFVEGAFVLSADHFWIEK